MLVMRTVEVGEMLAGKSGEIVFASAATLADGGAVLSPPLMGWVVAAEPWAGGG